MTILELITSKIDFSSFEPFFLILKPPWKKMWSNVTDVIVVHLTKNEPETVEWIVNNFPTNVQRGGGLLSRETGVANMSHRSACTVRWLNTVFPGFNQSYEGQSSAASSVLLGKFTERRVIQGCRKLLPTFLIYPWWARPLFRLNQRAPNSLTCNRLLYHGAWLPPNTAY